MEDNKKEMKEMKEIAETKIKLIKQYIAALDVEVARLNIETKYEEIKVTARLAGHLESELLSLKRLKLY